MPKMSMTMTEGTFVTWHKSEGEQVRAGEVVCEVATDKVDMEVEASVEGTISRLVAAPDDVVAVGEPIAYVASAADDLLEGLFDSPQPEQPEQPEPAKPEQAPEPEVQARRSAGGPPAVPAARRLAVERGIDLTAIIPTGPWGTIRLSDLDTAAGTVEAGNGALRRTARSVIAARMAASAQVPQFVVYRDIDLENASSARGANGWTAVITRALAGALRKHPTLNASWAEGAPRRNEQVGVALAVDTERGLLAPVIADPDHLDPGALSERIEAVVGRARAGKLALAELAAPASTTVSNLGGFGVTAFQALLTPPQATALSLGAVRPTVVPVTGGIGVRLRCTVGLSVDHRVADGAEAARLLVTVQELLDGSSV